MIKGQEEVTIDIKGKRNERNFTLNSSHGGHIITSLHVIYCKF